MERSVCSPGGNPQIDTTPPIDPYVAGNCGTARFRFATKCRGFTLYRSLDDVARRTKIVAANIKETAMFRLVAALLLFGAAVSPQSQESPDTELQSAIKATSEQGFSYLIKPVADIPKFNSARDELAGAVVKGETAGGVFHAQ